MCRRLLSTVALAAVLALGACSEQQQKSVTGPELSHSQPESLPLTPSCDFSGVKSLITSYFSSPLQQDARNLEQQMEAAGSQADRTQRGFDILSLAGQASRQGTPSALVGSNLTKALMRCMFDVTNTTDFPGFPDAFDFTAALTKAGGGAYYVRGGTSDATSTVIGTDYSGLTAENLSAVAPASGTWSGILQGNTLSGGRVLIYGSLVTAGPPLTYDWKLMPSNSSFGSPFALVSVCDGNTDQNAVVNESSIGFLPYVATSICNDTQSLTTLDRGWGPRALLQRAAHWSTDLLTPQSLEATMVRTGSGGTSTGFKSKFKTNGLTGLTVAFKKNEPPAKVKLNTQFPVTVVTTALDDQNVATGVANTCVYLTGSNNNGTPTQLQGPHDSRCTDVAGALSTLTDAGGTAQFKDATFTTGPKVTKNGGLLLHAFAKIIDRSVTGVAQAKTNVNP